MWVSQADWTLTYGESITGHLCVTACTEQILLLPWLSANVSHLLPHTDAAQGSELRVCSQPSQSEILPLLPPLSEDNIAGLRCPLSLCESQVDLTQVSRLKSRCLYQMNCPSDPETLLMSALLNLSPERA